MAEYEFQSTDSSGIRTTTQKLRAIIDEFAKKNLAIPSDILREIKELRSENKSRSKIDGWKFLRGLAADVVGKIDKFSG